MPSHHRLVWGVEAMMRAEGRRATGRWIAQFGEGERRVPQLSWESGDGAPEEDPDKILLAQPYSWS